VGHPKKLLPHAWFALWRAGRCRGAGGSGGVRRVAGVGGALGRRRFVGSSAHAARLRLRLLCEVCAELLRMYG